MTPMTQKMITDTAQGYSFIFKIEENIKTLGWGGVEKCKESSLVPRLYYPAT